MRRKLVLMAIMTITMLVSFGVNAMAQDAILFPYFSSGANGDLTFIQILNTSTVATPIAGTSAGNLHYIYVYNSGAEVCQHADQNGRTTRNDIMLFEATNSTPGLTGQLLPGDTTSTSYILPVKPSWGYLTVAHTDTNFAAGLEGELRGQAIIANTVAGTAYTYNAINDPSEADSGNMQFFSNADDHHMISWLPQNIASQVWFFFPVDGSDLADVSGPGDLVINNHIEIGHHPYHADPDGVYDNNELLTSGLKYLPVGCWNEGFNPADGNSTGVGAPMSANFFYTLAQMTSMAQYNAVKNTGGWLGVYHDDNFGNGYGYVYKITSSTALGKTMTTMVYEPNAYSHLSYVQ